MQNFSFEKASFEDLESIWEIILYAKEVRKKQGSTQWQDGYPKKETILTDIENSFGYVVKNSSEILAYIAIIFEEEEAYVNIKEGTWLNQDPYLVVHRMAVSENAKGLGLGKLMLKKAEEIALQKKYFNIKIDTNFDNFAMLKILNDLGYVFCGKVYFRGQERRAFQKILQK